MALNGHSWLYFLPDQLLFRLLIVTVSRKVKILVHVSHKITLLFIGFSSRVKVWKKRFHVISEYMHFVKYIPSQTGFELTRQFAAYIRARADFNLFMFDGTLCIFGVAFRRFARRFQMTGTITCNNHCTQTLFPRFGKMDFCPPRFQIGRLCTDLLAAYLACWITRCAHDSSFSDSS